MQVKSFSKTILAASAIAALSGCAGVHKQVEQNVQKTDTAIQGMKEQLTPVSTAEPLVSKVKGSYVANRKPMVETMKADLPDLFRTSFVSKTPGRVKVVDLLSRVSQEKGIQIKMSSELNNMMPIGNSTLGLAGTASSAGLPGLPTGLPMPSITAMGPSGGGGAQQGQVVMQPAATPAATQPQQGMSANRRVSMYDLEIADVVYDGPLSGFLDLLTSKLQVSWKYEKGAVTVYKYETRVFNVKALAGVGKVVNGVGVTSTSQSQGGQGSGAATSNSNRTDIIINADVWSNVERNISAFLSEDGKKSLAVSPDLGSVTVNDEPARLDAVGQYLEKLNKDLSRQVSLHMAVYSIEMNDKDAVSLDWKSVWQTAGSKFGASINGFTGLSNSYQAQQIGINILKGPWSGSNFILGALNTVGKTSLVTSGQVLTMNRQPAPLQVVEETNYLAKVSVTTTTTSTTTSIEPGNIVAGFSSTVTPKIEEDGEILLQFSGSLTELKELTTFTSPDGTSIQLPQKSLRDFLQRVRLRSGETMVMTGFEQARSTSTNAGVGHANNLLLGGKQDAQTKRNSLVVVITPYIID